MPQVLVITDEGEQLGTMAVSEALGLARQRGLDLVEVAPNAVPPVCRILDYGKLRYLYSKKEREAKKGQKTSELREVRLRPRIGTHDLSSKVRKVKELIDDGSKVKVAVVFRGREVTHPGIGLSRIPAPTNMCGWKRSEKITAFMVRWGSGEAQGNKKCWDRQDWTLSLLQRVADEVQDDARLERPPGMEGRAVSIVLVPGARKGEKKVAEVVDAQAENPQGS